VPPDPRWDRAFSKLAAEKTLEQVAAGIEGVDVETHSRAERRHR